MSEPAAPLQNPNFHQLEAITRDQLEAGKQYLLSDRKGTIDSFTFIASLNRTQCVVLWEGDKDTTIIQYSSYGLAPNPDNEEWEKYIFVKLKTNIR